jgi:hypothetical protein
MIGWASINNIEVVSKPSFRLKVGVDPRTELSI